MAKSQAKAQDPEVAQPHTDTAEILAFLSVHAGASSTNRPYTSFVAGNDMHSWYSFIHAHTYR